MQTFSEQLAAARSAAHMTQKQLSNAINVSRQTISSWERGRAQPDIEAIRLLSQVLDYAFDVSAPAEKPASEIKHDTLSAAYYRQETPNDPEKAYLTFEKRAWDEKGDYDTYQRYSFTMYETNGIGFNILCRRNTISS